MKRRILSGAWRYRAIIADKIRTVLKKRIKLHPNDDYATEKCWEEEVEILSENIEETIAFFRQECTEDEFSWLSEIFEDVAERPQSREFVSCLYEIAEQFPEETDKYHILYSIECAQDMLRE